TAASAARRTAGNARRRSMRGTRRRSDDPQAQRTRTHATAASAPAADGYRAGGSLREPPTLPEYAMRRRNANLTVTTTPLPSCVGVSSQESGRRTMTLSLVLSYAIAGLPAPEVPESPAHRMQRWLSQMSRKTTPRLLREL